MFTLIVGPYLAIAVGSLSRGCVVVCSEGCGGLRVMSIKTSLSMMSAGKFVDKLKCTLTFLFRDLLGSVHTMAHEHG